MSATGSTYHRKPKQHNIFLFSTCTEKCFTICVYATVRLCGMHELVRSALVFVYSIHSFLVILQSCPFLSHSFTFGLTWIVSYVVYYTKPILCVLCICVLLFSVWLDRNLERAYQCMHTDVRNVHLSFSYNFSPNMWYLHPHGAHLYTHRSTTTNRHVSHGENENIYKHALFYSMNSLFDSNNHKGEFVLQRIVNAFNAKSILNWIFFNLFSFIKC